MKNNYTAFAAFLNSEQTDHQLRAAFERSGWNEGELSQLVQLRHGFQAIASGDYVKAREQARSIDSALNADLQFCLDMLRLLVPSDGALERALLSNATLLLDEVASRVTSTRLALIAVPKWLLAFHSIRACLAITGIGQLNVAKMKESIQSIVQSLLDLDVRALDRLDVAMPRRALIEFLNLILRADISGISSEEVQRLVEKFNLDLSEEPGMGF